MSEAPELNPLDEAKREARDRRVEPALQLTLVATAFRNEIMKLTLEIVKEDFDPIMVLDMLHDAQAQLQNDLARYAKRVRLKCAMAMPDKFGRPTDREIERWERSEGMRQARRRRAKARA